MKRAHTGTASPSKRMKHNKQLVLLGVDHSRVSDRAFAYAVDLLDPARAKIILLSVFTSYKGPAEFDHNELMKDEEAALKKHMAEHLTTLENRGFEWEYHTVPGVAKTTLCEKAEEFDVDLIVLGSRSHDNATFCAPFNTSSVSTHVACHATRSVLVVKHGVVPEAGKARVFTVGYDTSDISKEVLRKTLLLARKGDQVHLVHAVPPLQSMVDAEDGFAELLQAVDKRRAEKSREQFSGAVASCKHAEVEVHTSCPEGDPRQLLKDAARRHHADILAVGSRGLGKLERMVLGSVSSHLLHEARSVSAVLIGRPRARVQD